MSTQLRHSAGWSRREGNGFYRNSYSLARARGSTLSFKAARLRRLALVATRCPDCGVVDIYLANTRVRRVNLAGSRSSRNLISAIDSEKLRTGDITIRVASSGRRVMIEGLAISSLRTPLL